MLAVIPAFPETGVELVIGNDNYAVLPELNNGGAGVRSFRLGFHAAQTFPR
jgi:hypothetical protein